MKKTWLATAATLCFGLAVATTYLLLTPVTALAATGYAKCGINPTVYCTAYKCACIENIGCTAEDANGKLTDMPCGGRPTRRDGDGDGGPAPVESNN